MKIVRFLDPGGIARVGVEHDNTTTTLLDGDLFGTYSDSGIAADVTKRLAPVVPSAIMCIGLNYRKHAEEGGKPIPEHPVLFMKLPTAVQNPGDPILLPTHLASHKVDYECELAVVIGRDCKNVQAADALDYVLGYMCANDVSARDWQAEWGGSQWCRGKTFDTFCPIGPVLVTSDELTCPNDLQIQSQLNGQTMQQGTTSDMIFDVATLIEFLSGSTRLAAGTVILTGTPPGVGFARKPPVYLQDGDTISVHIDGIGTLTNTVQREA